MDETLSLGSADGPGWTLFVAGDVALEPGAREADAPILSERLHGRVADADLAVANLEAPIAGGSATPIPKSGPAIRGDERTPERLAEAGFDLVTLANNHAMDYGADALADTMAVCRDAGLGTVGAGTDRAAALEPAERTIGGTDVAVAGLCEREFGVAGADGPGTAWSGHRSALAAVREAGERADAVIVLAHGGVEYVPFPPPPRHERLHEFVDAGADAVVGHHPHVPQGWETPGDGAILHSLGNFLFDRQADADATSWGLAAEVRFAGAVPVAVELVPTEVVDGVVHPLGAERSRAEHLEYLHRVAEILAGDFEPHWQAVAVRTFHATHSTWLLRGIGDNLTRANAEPHDPDAHRPLWDPDRRREELLTLLNVVRNESHRAVVTDALATLAGERPDERTPEVEATVDDLLARTRP